MQRKFFRGFLICLIPCLAAGFFAFRFDKYKLGIDLAGGTILVYEINLERTKQLNATREEQGPGPRTRTSAVPSEGLSSDDMLKLASQIKRRIDPADLKNVTVRPLGNTRLEIILPTGGSGGSRSNLTTEEIEEVKRLVSQMGVLEFRILANTVDDEAGIRTARELIDTASPDDLSAWASRGLPPVAPPDEFEVKAESEKASKVRYAWVELGPTERETIGLQNASEVAGAAGGALWSEAARSRNKAFVHNYGNEGKAASMVLFSRAVDPRSPRAMQEIAAVRQAVKSGGLPESTIREPDGQEKTPEKIYQLILTDAAVGDAVKVPDGVISVTGPKRFEYFVLTRVSPVDNVRVEGDISLSASADTDSKLNPCVAFRFNGPGAQAFGRMTERNKPGANTIRALAISLDDRIVSAPTLNAVITSAGQISGRFDAKSVNRLVTFLRNGALNAQLREKPVSENTIGPTLGADTIHKGTLAVGLAFGVVLLFMLGYYRFAGVVACVALLANLLLTVGFMVGVNAAFTLPGLAGIVLMLGMAVDANVLIYERLREERNKGANLVTAIRNGYDRAFPTIIDTHLSSIFTAIVLYTFGNDQLKGFAISLTVGLAISLFTSLYMTRLMFDYRLHTHGLTELRMMRLFERPSFNPMKYRFALFTTTSILTILGLGLFLVRGDSGLNVDFRGGTVYAGRLKDGEERALTTTGGTLGLRELLSAERQQDRLKVTDVRWANRPASGDVTALGTYTFEITYQDGTTTSVSLTQKPDGNTDKEMEEAVKARAQHLPDISVEQIFLSTDPTFPDGKSRYFTVRTTERQPDLVRASLDKLLRSDPVKAGDPGLPLVASTDVRVGPVTGPVVELSFDRPTSPSLMRDMLDREFSSASASDGATTFELIPTGETDGGRYKTMRLDVSKNARLAALRKKALADDTGGPAAAAVVGYSVASATAAAFADPDLEAQIRTLKSILDKSKRAIETRPEPERLEVFDSTLASETRTKALWAIVWSWVAILLYLWFRFGSWTFGAAAVICLIHDLCFTLGAIAICHYLYDNPFGQILGLEDFKIDLPTVAALLTLVGYSVSDTIVVFDRIREVRGKNPALTPQMINDSVNQTLSRTVLASLTVFLVVTVLYWFGGEGVHLFAYVMVIGVMVGTYSSVFVASPLLLLFGEGHGEQSATPTEAFKTEEEAVVEG
jgi:SecD/SecF fusion protein